MRISLFLIVIGIAYVLAFVTSPPDPVTLWMLFGLYSITGCLAVLMLPRVKR